MTRHAALLFAVLVLPVTARAETLLDLSNSAVVSAQPDEFAASLRAEEAAPSASAAQAQVNQAMRRALARIHATAGVSVTTGAYAVWNTPPPPESRPSPPSSVPWHASQGLELRGADRAAILSLVGVLQQQGLEVEQLGPLLSAKAREAARDQALRQALSGLRARAEEAASLLGLRFVSFRSVHIGQPEPIAPPGPMLAMRAAAGATPPSIESGAVPVSATVTAEAVLMPPQGPENRPEKKPPGAPPGGH